MATALPSRRRSPRRGARCSNCDFSAKPWATTTGSPAFSPASTSTCRSCVAVPELHGARLVQVVGESDEHERLCRSTRCIAAGGHEQRLRRRAGSGCAPARTSGRAARRPGWPPRRGACAMRVRSSTCARNPGQPAGEHRGRAARPRVNSHRLAHLRTRGSAVSGMFNIAHIVGAVREREQRRAGLDQRPAHGGALDDLAGERRAHFEVDRLLAVVAHAFDRRPR